MIFFLTTFPNLKAQNTCRRHCCHPLPTTCCLFCLPSTYPTPWATWTRMPGQSPPSTCGLSVLWYPDHNKNNENCQKLVKQDLAGLGQQQQVAAASVPTIHWDEIPLFQVLPQVSRDGVFLKIEVVECSHQEIKRLKFWWLKAAKNMCGKWSNQPLNPIPAIQPHPPTHSDQKVIKMYKKQDKIWPLYYENYFPRNRNDFNNSLKWIELQSKLALLAAGFKYHLLWMSLIFIHPNQIIQVLQGIIRLLKEFIIVRFWFSK